MRKGAPMNTSTIRVLLIILALFAVSCATTGNQMSAGTDVIHKVISANDIHEDCAKAMPGQKIVYSFEASMPVDFNIHFHEAGKVNYGVFEPGASRMDESTYVIEKEQYYCLMWTNKNAADVRLDYTFKITE